MIDAKGTRRNQGQPTNEDAVDTRNMVRTIERRMLDDDTYFGMELSVHLHLHSGVIVLLVSSISSFCLLGACLLYCFDTLQYLPVHRCVGSPDVVSRRYGYPVYMARLENN